MVHVPGSSISPMEKVEVHQFKSDITRDSVGKVKKSERGAWPRWRSERAVFLELCCPGTETARRRDPSLPQRAGLCGSGQEQRLGAAPYGWTGRGARQEEEEEAGPLVRCWWPAGPRAAAGDNGGPGLQVLEETVSGARGNCGAAGARARPGPTAYSGRRQWAAPSEEAAGIAWPPHDVVGGRGLADMQR
ncbi:hypothetical protein NDU88_006484 [Pleurodeles waltl]|uniref:Uncharacterized protein n=1 Tax=Pleurodeles waltl TaxID=8319 RepID=A0AAV7RLL0_PLEWA|nr:hypothetical protein NDU88_006484 [Pleurodeles waltl]